MKRLKESNILILLAVFVLLTVVLAITTPGFLSVAYLTRTMKFMTESGLIAIAMAFVILTGGIDLSVGSVIALSSVSLGMMCSAGIPPVLSLLITLVVGLICGMLNGIVVGALNIPPMVVTLATMSLYRGIAVGLSMGNSYHMPDEIIFLGQGLIGPVPVQFLILLFALFSGLFILKRTNMGQNLKAIGFNEEAARYTGIRVLFEKVRVYMLSGALSAAVGILLACRVGSAKADYGVGSEMDAITIAVFGGATLSGGRINLAGSFIAATIITLMKLGMTIAIIPSEVQSIFIGVILMLSIVLNNRIFMRKETRM